MKALSWFAIAFVSLSVSLANASNNCWIKAAVKDVDVRIDDARYVRRANHDVNSWALYSYVGKGRKVEIVIGDRTVFNIQTARWKLGFDQKQIENMFNRMQAALAHAGNEGFVLINIGTGEVEPEQGFIGQARGPREACQIE